MRRFLIASLLLLSILLPGCFGATGLTVDQETAISCRAYAAALASLVPFKADMKPAQVQTVDTARAVINPICEAASKGGTATATQLNSLRASLQALLVVEKEFKQ